MLEDEGARPIWAYWEERFGVPAGMERRFLLWERGTTYWILSGCDVPPEAMRNLRVVTVGVPFLRKIRHRLKPTTTGLRLLAPWISRNRFELTPPQVLELLSSGEIPWPKRSEGYVLLETHAGVLGCGLMGKGVLRSQIPLSQVRVLGLISVNAKAGHLRQDKRLTSRHDDDNTGRNK